VTGNPRPRVQIPPPPPSFHACYRSSDDYFSSSHWTESARQANNFYVWDSKEAALEFFSDELRQRVTDLYGVAPTIEYVEIAQIVDNSAS
jgi:hypothetical protein